MTVSSHDPVRLQEGPKKKKSRRALILAAPLLLAALFALDVFHHMPHHFPAPKVRNMGSPPILGFVMDVILIFVTLFLLICEKLGARATPTRVVFAGAAGVLAAIYFAVTPPRVGIVYTSGPHCLVIGVGGGAQNNGGTHSAPAPSPSGPGV